MYKYIRLTCQYSENVCNLKIITNFISNFMLYINNIFNILYLQLLICLYLTAKTQIEIYLIWC